MAKHIAEGVALGLRYDIYDRTGRVTRSETRSETEVQENESGGGLYLGWYRFPGFGLR